MRKIAAIGDVHGCIGEFETMYRRLQWLSLDGIYHLGDLVDRGPDSGAVVQFCRENAIEGVLGNHEESILKIWKRLQTDPNTGMNDDKRNTISQLRAEDIAYLEALPLTYEFPDLNAVLVHGGLWPWVPINKQPKNVVRAQMINPGKPGDTRWFGKDAALHKSGKNEEQNHADGYRRWYEVYNHPQQVFYGHSVFSQPMLYTPPGFGQTVGIDTGSCFGGALTAAIISDEDPWFVTIKAKKVHFEKSFRVHQEA